MNKATVDLVRRRSAGRCEYCQSVERFSRLSFQVEHIIAKQHGGDDLEKNLALACGFCNSHKGPNLSGIDPSTLKITSLFHPRRQNWSAHFSWNGAVLFGITDVGRATIAVLSMNHPLQIGVRSALMAEGVF